MGGVGNQSWSRPTQSLFFLHHSHEGLPLPHLHHMRVIGATPTQAHATIHSVRATLTWLELLLKLLLTHTKTGATADFLLLPNLGRYPQSASHVTPDYRRAMVIAHHTSTAPLWSPPPLFSAPFCCWFLGIVWILMDKHQRTVWWCMDVVIGDEENCLVYLLLFVFRDLNFSRLLFFESESDYGSVVNCIVVSLFALFPISFVFIESSLQIPLELYSQSHVTFLLLEALSFS